MSNSKQQEFQYDIPIDAFKRRRICFLIALVVLPIVAFVSAYYAVINEPKLSLVDQWPLILVFAIFTGSLSAILMAKIFSWLDVIPGNHIVLSITTSLYILLASWCIYQFALFSFKPVFI
jgi:hypothetical protein